MAYKPSPNSLIHCATCGEDYSVTYKRCPFCGAKNAPQQPAPDPSPASSNSNLEDTYVFDGQDLFDDQEEEDYVSARPKGGKRLAEKPLSNPFANADINWPRVITFVCSLVIIVAAMVIVFTWIYPQLRNDDDPVAEGTPTAPAGDSTQGVDPSAAVSGTEATDPGTETSDNVPPEPAVLNAISFKGATDNDFTLQPGASHTITLNFDPADWSGDVTWSSTDTRYATVDANGKVTNVNSTDRLRSVTITVSAGGFSLESTVYCRGVAAATEPPASEPPASDPPATQSPSGSGGVTVGKEAVVVNASSGLNVRSGPGTSYSRIASLVNGNTVNVLEETGGGWYKISFRGSNGADMEGYVLGTYISTK